MKATTYGIGLLIKKIIDLGFKKIIVGLGGSITNDGGSGLLEALGAKFYQDDLLVELHKTPFKMINKADLKVVLELLKDIDLNILCDVSNPLLGPSGATNVFSEQKGSTPEQRLFLESWMKSYKMSLSSLDLEGFGAAGGLGFAFYMIGGKLKKGIEVLLNSINFENSIDEDTLVITGEGKLDKTSLQGKVVGYISEVVNKKKAGLAIICGINELENTSFNIYPLHQNLPLNYKETVKTDLIKVFKRIVKEYFIDYDFLEVENVNKDDERYRKLRIDVFVKEQQIDEAIEFDELEEEAEHYILKYQNQPVGCFRLRYLKDYLKLERFLVKKEYRNLDFALAMITFVKRVMKEKNINECLIHAQLSAQKFYEKGGFVSFGEVFQEADIDHILMKLEV